MKLPPSINKYAFSNIHIIFTGILENEREKFAKEVVKTGKNIATEMSMGKWTELEVN